MKQLIKKFYKGAVLNVSSGVALYIISFVVTIVLMKFIGPSEFGTIALINIFLGFLFLFSDLGLNNLVIQKQNISELEINSIIVFRVVVSLILIAVFYLVSFIIESYYNVENLSFYMMLCSSILFFNSIGSVGRALANRQLKFKKLVNVRIVSILITSLMAVLLAICDYGIYALIARQVLPTIIMLYLFVTIGYKIKLQFDTKLFGRLLNQSRFYSYSQIFSFLTNKVDKFLISSFLDTTQLGFYDKSFSMSHIPVDKIKSKVLSALYPVLSKLKKNNTELQLLILQVSRGLTALCLPIILIIYCYIESFVEMFLSDEWTNLGYFIKMFCVLAAIQIPFFPGYIFNIKDEMKSKFRLDLIVKPIWLIILIFSVYNFGLIGAIVGLTLAVLINNFVFNIKASKLVDLRFYDLIKNVSLHFLSIILIVLLIEFLENSNLQFFTNTNILKLIVLVIGLLIFYIKFITPEIRFIKKLA